MLSSTAWWRYCRGYLCQKQHDALSGTPLIEGNKSVSDAKHGRPTIFLRNDYLRETHSGVHAGVSRPEAIDPLSIARIVQRRAAIRTA